MTEKPLFIISIPNGTFPQLEQLKTLLRPFAKENNLVVTLKETQPTNLIELKNWLESMIDVVKNIPKEEPVKEVEVNEVLDRQIREKANAILKAEGKI